MTYQFKSEHSHILRRLRNSRATKIKHGYSRDISAGFIEDDLQEIHELDNGTLFIRFAGTETQADISGLNLRETEEAIKWLEKNQEKN